MVAQKSQFYEECEQCRMTNDSIKRCIIQEGSCNEAVGKQYYAKNNIHVANESNPRICFCLPCWEAIQENPGYQADW